jgi:hypothetical protein
VCVLWAIRWSTHEHEGRAALAPRLCAAREQVRKCLPRIATRAAPFASPKAARTVARTHAHHVATEHSAVHAFAVIRGRHAGARACKSCQRSMSVKRRLLASTSIGHPQLRGLQRGRDGYGRQPQGIRASLSVSEFRLNGASHGCLQYLAPNASVGETVARTWSAPP